MADKENTYVISRRILARLGKTLDNPQRILVGIRGILKAQSQDCFKRQAFGEIKWPARYPSQRSPKLNVAGAVQDLAKKPRIKAHRFQDRPALIDTGILRRDITSVIKPASTGDYVQLGVSKTYAKVHQQGGETRAPITQTIRDNLKIFLKSLRTKRGGYKQPGKKYAKALATQGLSGGEVMYKAVRKRLGFLFKVNELVTKVNARPFLGITDESIRKTERLIIDTLRPLGAQEA